MHSKIDKWSIAQRLAYIDFCLKWYGKLNRSTLMNRFKISVPQASLDIARYCKLAPNNIIYDRSAKSYVRTDTFIECYPESSSAKAFLSELLTSAERTLLFQSLCSRIPTLERGVNDSITAKIVLGIENKQTVEIRYQSMTRDEPSIRRILPKTLVFTDSRWHVRAFCFKKEKYLDFVLARVLDVSKPKELRNCIPEDKDWETIVTLIIEPAKGLNASQKSIIEYDYGMQEHVLKMQCRKAFLFYILKKYRFLNPWRTPRQQEIELKNIDEIKSYLTEKEISVLSDNIGDRA